MPPAPDPEPGPASLDPVSGMKASLLRLALAALPRFLDGENRRLVFRLRAKGKQGDGIRASSEIPLYSTSDRYLFLCAIGLFRYRRVRQTPGECAFFNPCWSAALERLDDSIRSAPAAGWLDDAAVALWAAAEAQAPETNRLAAEVQRGLHSCSSSAPFLPAQTLAWCVTALTEADRAKEAEGALASLLATRGRSGLFRESAATGRYATFNHQVYAAQACFALAKKTGNAAALDAGQRAIELLLSAQRRDGGWPWLYDTEPGRVADPYPLYAVHQSGMGPMLLRSASECGVTGTDDALARSLGWLFGENPLRLPLVDPESGLLWRAIRRAWRGGRRRWFGAFARRGWGELNPLLNLPFGLELNRESRPYHYGWILYAHS